MNNPPITYHRVLTLCAAWLILSTINYPAVAKATPKAFASRAAWQATAKGQMFERDRFSAFENTGEPAS
jgi:hypothetical protein